MDLSAIFTRLIETQSDSIQPMVSKNLIVVVHDDAQQVKLFQEINAHQSAHSPKVVVFDNDDQCNDFVVEKVSEDPDIKMIVFAGGRLVQDLVLGISGCDQVKEIFILNKPPFSEEERQFMKEFPKVTYVADLLSTETASASDRPLTIEPISETRFTDLLSIKLVNKKQFDENTCEEPKDRTFKQFDRDYVFRYLTLMCLLDAQPVPGMNNDLIALFKRESLASTKEIKEFQETYSPSTALHFYTKDVFIYGRLNAALRTKNTGHLLPFRFVLQNICEQLYQRMTNGLSDQTLTLYRAQRSTQFEIADLILAYQQKSPVVINSFFSTSRDKEVSVKYLDDTKVGDMDDFQILFTITARRQDASRHFPFADVSKISQYPEEKEVLFAPGQLFNINNIKIIFIKNVRIHSIEMSLLSEFDERFAPVRQEFETLLGKNMNDSLLCLARLLIEFDQPDEAKQLYQQCLLEYEDKERKHTCYEGLFCIAGTQNDIEEAKRMYQKMTEMKFGDEQATTNFYGIPMTPTEADEFHTGFDKIRRMDSLLSFNQPFDELLASIEGDEFRHAVEQGIHSQYEISATQMKKGMFALAVQLLEPALQIMELGQIIPFDPLLKSRCCMQLGYGYRQLKLYDKSLKFYELALEQKAHVPLDEYIQILIGFATIYENTNDYESALHKYIEIAEIYQNNSTIGDLAEHQQNEESIRRVTLHLIPSD